MDIQLIYLNFVAFLLFISVVSLLAKGWRKLKHQRLPPSPWQLPLIGHLHHLVGTLPHHTLRNLSKKYGPIIYLKLGKVSMIVISLRYIAKSILTAHDLVFVHRSKRFGMKTLWHDYIDIALSPYNDCWRQMHKVNIMEVLRNKNVSSFSSIRLDKTTDLIESIQSSCREPINLTEKYSHLQVQLHQKL